jgi:hypothetical protein
MFHARPWVVGSTVALVLAVTTGAAAEGLKTGAIDPGHGVNGMLVVQGLERDADLSIWTYCNPVVTAPGPEARKCSLPPSSRRIFAGYGIWGASRRIVDEAWHKRAWRLWIDGQAVHLGRFGTEERWIANPSRPGAKRQVLLRLWTIVLVGARGTHSIRYRSRLEDGGPFTSNAWKFTVPPR